MPRTRLSAPSSPSPVLDDAVGEGILGYNPLASLKARQKGKRRKGNLIPRARNLKEQRILSPKEIDSLLSAAKTDRYRVLLATAIFTGLRQMELLGLTWAMWTSGEDRSRPLPVQSSWGASPLHEIRRGPARRCHSR